MKAWSTGTWESYGMGAGELIGMVTDAWKCAGEVPCHAYNEEDLFFVPVSERFEPADPELADELDPSYFGPPEAGSPFISEAVATTEKEAVELWWNFYYRFGYSEDLDEIYADLQKAGYAVEEPCYENRPED